MKLLRNIAAVVVGWFVGSIVNMAIVLLGQKLISMPQGFDPSTVESFSQTAHLLSGQHYIAPIIAHAAGTFAGAFIAVLIAANNKKVMALIVGILFLIGGVVACMMIPAPVWFVVIDLIAAYIPMAWLGWKLCPKK